MRSRPVGFLPAHAGDRGAQRRRSSAACRRRRRCCRGWAPAPLRRRTSSPLRRPGSRCSRAQATRVTPSSVSLALKVSVPSSLPKSLGGHGHRDAHPAVAEQRPDASDRDLLDRRGAVGAPVVGEEGDLRVRALRRRVEQRVHRLVVALLPRAARTARRSRGARRCRAGRARPRSRRSPTRGQDHEQHEQDRQRRPGRATPPPAGVLGRGKEQRTGPGGVPERSGTTSTSAGHRSVVLAGPPDLLPSDRG